MISVYGNLVVGPTAEVSEERSNPVNTNEVLCRLIGLAESLLPGLKKYKVVASYAGLRPATEHADYRISVSQHR